MRGASSQLQLAGRNGWHPRTVELLANKLRLSNNESEFNDSLFGTEDEIIVLTGAQVTRSGNQFTITPENGDSPYTFKCETDEEARMWHRTVAQEIEDHQAQKEAEQRRRTERKAAKAAKDAQGAEPATVGDALGCNEEVLSIVEQQLSLRSKDTARLPKGPESSGGNAGLDARYEKLMKSQSPSTNAPETQPEDQEKPAVTCAPSISSPSAGRRGVTFSEDRLESIRTFEIDQEEWSTSEYEQVEPQPAKYSKKFNAQTELTEGLLSTQSDQSEEATKCCPKCCIIS